MFEKQPMHIIEGDFKMGKQTNNNGIIKRCALSNLTLTQIRSHRSALKLNMNRK